MQNMEIAGWNIRECSVRLSRCDFSSRRSAVRLEGSVPAAPHAFVPPAASCAAGHLQEYVTAPLMVIKTEDDDKDVFTVQEPDSVLAHLSKDAVTDIGWLIKEENGFLVKTEDEAHEVMVKQELDIGPTVLQPASAPRAQVDPRPSTSSGGGAALPPLCKSMANRVSNEQLEELLEFLAEHPAIARGVGAGIRSKETIDKHWNDLANKLNSYGSGSSKSGERWKKYWADFKHKSKSRLAKRRWDALSTGGGPGSQDDLSELDKKVLAIIGEKAVFGDSVHKVPVFNMETDTVHEEIVLGIQNEDVISQEIPNSNVTENLSVIVYSPSRTGRTSRVYTDITTDSVPTSVEYTSVRQQTPQVPKSLQTGNVTENLSVIANSPSRRGRTNRVYTDITTDSVRASAGYTSERQQTQQAPEPLQTGVESPVSRPSVDRPHYRRNRNRLAHNTTVQSRVNPEWVIELERNRVEAENKLANAALIMAEASRTHAETAQAQLELTRELVQIMHQQSEEIRALLQMTREQANH